VHVIATARNPAVLIEMAAIGMTTLPLDVTNEDSIKACHDEVAKVTGGKLDILVNNASVFPLTPPFTATKLTNPQRPHPHTPGHRPLDP